jgi:hypothetical protein
MLSIAHKLLSLRSLYWYAKSSKEVFKFSHKNNVNFLWPVTPQFFCAVLLRVVRGLIL